MGESAGGSGHLGFSDFEILKIRRPVPVKNRPGRWDLYFEYRITVETEFTYEPDNPPAEYVYSKSITIDEKGTVPEEDSKQLLRTNRDFLLSDPDEPDDDDFE